MVPPSSVGLEASFIPQESNADLLAASRCVCRQGNCLSLYWTIHDFVSFCRNVSVLSETLPTISGDPFESDNDTTYHPGDSSSSDVETDSSMEEVEQRYAINIYVYCIDMFSQSVESVMSLQLCFYMSSTGRALSYLVEVTANILMDLDGRFPCIQFALDQF